MKRGMGSKKKATLSLAALSLVGAGLMYAVARYYSWLDEQRRQEEEVEEFLAAPRGISLQELSQCNGENGRDIYIAVKGKVYFVNARPEGREFYGPDGPYHCFAGSDASVALAKLSFDKLNLNRQDWDTLSFAERDTLQDWIDKFELRYPVIGWISDWAEASSSTTN